jgi:hypothetical protein
MTLALANLVAAAVLCGLIWTIQVVHYPLFARVPEAAWASYEADHQRRITTLVLPLMLANVGFGVALLLDPGAPDGLAAANLALAAGIFAATGAFYAPIHGRLAERHDPDLLLRLVRLNWWRTAAWTVQLAIAVALLQDAVQRTS